MSDPGQGNWQTPPPAAPSGFTPAPMAAGPAPGVVYADLMMRIIALVIDAVIIGVLGSIISFIASAVAGGISGSGFIFLFVGGIVSAAVSIGYCVYTWTTMRASPGQKILGLETVNAADGATLTQNQAIRRWAFLFGPGAIIGIVPFLALIAWPLEFLYGLYLLYTTNQSPKRQGFHDVQAGTVVVKRV
jgi:uncharacterized RDD family membrane protein YckC